MGMRKRNFYITKQQDAALIKLMEKKGLKVSEQIRRAIDLYLEREQKSRAFS